MKSEEWVGKVGSRDNTYEGTFGQDGWGYKAQQVLTPIASSVKLSLGPCACTHCALHMRAQCNGDLLQCVQSACGAAAAQSLLHLTSIAQVRGAGVGAGAGQGLQAREDEEEAGLLLWRQD